VVVAAISPYRAIRDEVRAEIGAFVEVFVRCPVEELIRRDVKGLYEKAFAGEIKEFTGVSDPYEAPTSPDIVLHTEEQTPERSAQLVFDKLEEKGLLYGEVRV
jgi:adenylylsulfate kinase-like enzyme